MYVEKTHKSTLKRSHLIFECLTKESYHEHSLGENPTGLDFVHKVLFQLNPMLFQYHFACLGVQRYRSLVYSQYFIRIIAKVCSDFPIVFVFSTSRCFSYPLLQFKSNSSRLMTVSPCDLAMIWNWFPSFSSPTPLDVSYASLLSPQSVNCKEEKSDLTNN